MDNGDIVVEHLSDEQNPHINNVERENSTPKQSNLEGVINVNTKKMNKPMNPTPLYSFFFFSLIIK